MTGSSRKQEKLFKLRVMTFNLWAVPVVGIKTIDRIDALMQYLKETEYDIIGFQECFVHEAQEKLRKELPDAGLKYFMIFCSGADLPCRADGSGCVIASRYPILETSWFTYSSCGSPLRLDQWDWHAGKGIGLARILLPGQNGTADVYVSHFVAKYSEGINDGYGSQRVMQALEASVFIRTTRRSDLTILLTDLNSAPDTLVYKTLSMLAGFNDAYSCINTNEELLAGVSTLTNLREISTTALPATPRPTSRKIENLIESEKSSSNVPPISSISSQLKEVTKDADTRVGENSSEETMTPVVLSKNDNSDVNNHSEQTSLTSIHSSSEPSLLSRKVDETTSTEHDQPSTVLKAPQGVVGNDLDSKEDVKGDVSKIQQIPVPTGGITITKSSSLSSESPSNTETRNLPFHVLIDTKDVEGETKSPGTLNDEVEAIATSMGTFVTHTKLKRGPTRSIFDATFGVPGNAYATTAWNNPDRTRSKIYERFHLRGPHHRKVGSTSSTPSSAASTSGVKGPRTAVASSKDIHDIPPPGHGNTRLDYILFGSGGSTWPFLNSPGSGSTLRRVWLVVDSAIRLSEKVHLRDGTLTNLSDHSAVYAEFGCILLKPRDKDKDKDKEKERRKKSSHSISTRSGTPTEPLVKRKQGHMRDLTDENAPTLVSRSQDTDLKPDQDNSLPHSISSKKKFSRTLRNFVMSNKGVPEKEGQSSSAELQAEPFTFPQGSPTSDRSTEKSTSRQDEHAPELSSVTTDVNASLSDSEGRTGASSIHEMEGLMGDLSSASSSVSDSEAIAKALHEIFESAAQLKGHFEYSNRFSHPNLGSVREYVGSNADSKSLGTNFPENGEEGTTARSEYPSDRVPIISGGAVSKGKRRERCTTDIDRINQLPYYVPSAREESASTPEEQKKGTIGKGGQRLSPLRLPSNREDTTPADTSVSEKKGEDKGKLKGGLKSYAYRDILYRLSDLRPAVRRSHMRIAAKDARFNESSKPTGGTPVPLNSNRVSENIPRGKISRGRFDRERLKQVAPRRSLSFSNDSASHRQYSFLLGQDGSVGTYTKFAIPHLEYLTSHRHMEPFPKGETPATAVSAAAALGSHSKDEEETPSKFQIQKPMERPSTRDSGTSMTPKRKRSAASGRHIPPYDAVTRSEEVNREEAFSSGESDYNGYTHRRYRLPGRKTSRSHSMPLTASKSEDGQRNLINERSSDSENEERMMDTRRTSNSYSPSKSRVHSFDVAPIARAIDLERKLRTALINAGVPLDRVAGLTDLDFSLDGLRASISDHQRMEDDASQAYLSDSNHSDGTGEMYALAERRKAGESDNEGVETGTAGIEAPFESHEPDSKGVEHSDRSVSKLGYSRDVDSNISKASASAQSGGTASHSAEDYEPLLTSTSGHDSVASSSSNTSSIGNLHNIITDSLSAVRSDARRAGDSSKSHFNFSNSNVHAGAPGYMKGTVAGSSTSSYPNYATKASAVDKSLLAENMSNMQDALSKELRTRALALYRLITAYSGLVPLVLDRGFATDTGVDSKTGVHRPSISDSLLAARQHAIDLENVGEVDTSSNLTREIYNNSIANRISVPGHQNARAFSQPQFPPSFASDGVGLGITDQIGIPGGLSSGGNTERALIALNGLRKSLQESLDSLRNSFLEFNVGLDVPPPLKSSPTKDNRAIVSTTSGNVPLDDRLQPSYQSNKERRAQIGEALTTAGESKGRATEGVEAGTLQTPSPIDQSPAVPRQQSTPEDNTTVLESFLRSFQQYSQTPSNAVATESDNKSLKPSGFLSFDDSVMELTEKAPDFENFHSEWRPLLREIFDSLEAGYVGAKRRQKQSVHKGLMTIGSAVIMSILAGVVCPSNRVAPLVYGLILGILFWGQLLMAQVVLVTRNSKGFTIIPMLVSTMLPMFAWGAYKGGLSTVLSAAAVIALVFAYINIWDAVSYNAIEKRAFQRAKEQLIIMRNRPPTVIA